MKKKNIFLLIFFVAILFAVLFMPNEVMADTHIDKIYYTITEIKPGNTIPSNTSNFVTTEPSSQLSDFEYPNLTWYVSDTGVGDTTNTPSESTFTVGKYYRCVIADLTSWDTPVTIDDQTEYYINGKKVSNNFQNEWTLAGTPLTEVRITMPEIKAGNEIPANATFTTVPANAYSLNTCSLTWRESSIGTALIPGGGTYVSERKFMANYYYYFDFNLGTSSQYVIGESTKVYINDVEQTTKSWIKAEGTKVTEINLDVSNFEAGKKVKDIIFNSYTTKPESAKGNAQFAAMALKSENDVLDILDDDYVLKEDEEYIFLIAGNIYDDVEYYTDSSLKWYLNGKEGTYMEIYSSNWGVFSPTVYTYKLVDGNNQEFNKGKIDSFVFTVDGNYDEFESLKVGELELIKDVDYTVTRGSTIISFTDAGIAKLNQLEAGKYNVEVKFTSNTVTGEIVINKEENNIENPQTGDTIMYFTAGMVLSVLGAYFVKRKFIK